MASARARERPACHDGRAASGRARKIAGQRRRDRGGRRRRRDCLRRAADVGGLDAERASLFAVARQTRLGRGAADFRPRPIGAARALRGRLQGRIRAGEALDSGARAGAEAAVAAGFVAARQLRAIKQPTRPTRSAAISATPAAPAARMPRRSSISRTTSAPRTSASRCGRACARSSTSSATRRPAWRPIRARPPTSMRSPSPLKRCSDRCRRSASRRSASPIRPSLSARSPAPRATICSIRSAAPRSIPAAEEQGAVFEDVGLWKRAWYFPQGRRRHARGRRARMQADASERRPVRRLHARQDRGRRPRRRGLPRKALHEPLGEARGRAAAAMA